MVTSLFLVSCNEKSPNAQSDPCLHTDLGWAETQALTEQTFGGQQQICTDTASIAEALHLDPPEDTMPGQLSGPGASVRNGTFAGKTVLANRIS